MDMSTTRLSIYFDVSRCMFSKLEGVLVVLFIEVKAWLPVTPRQTRKVAFTSMMSFKETP